MSERVDGIPSPEHVKDEEEILEEKAAEIGRFIEQAQMDREKLWPIVREFKAGDRSFLHRTLNAIQGREGEAGALESASSPGGEIGLDSLEVVYAYGDMLQKLDDCLRQEIFEAHSRISDLVAEYWKKQAATKKEMFSETNELGPENQ